MKFLLTLMSFLLISTSLLLSGCASRFRDFSHPTKCPECTATCSCVRCINVSDVCPLHPWIDQKINTPAETPSTTENNTTAVETTEQKKEPLAKKQRRRLT